MVKSEVYCDHIYHINDIKSSASVIPYLSTQLKLSKNILLYFLIITIKVGVHMYITMFA